MTRPTVVFLHGLARTHRSLGGLRRHVEAAGFPTWTVTYPSRQRSLEALAAWLAERLEQELPGRTLSAVTHSMGGILARHVRVAWGRVVMLAPPNQGSAVARALEGRRAFQSVYGPAAGQLARPVDWPLPECPVGVVAGTRGPSIGNPPSWFAAGLGLLPSAPHDGLVAVDETRLPGMTDFATVHASHTWIMDHPRARELVVRFLETGAFRDP